MIFKIRLPENVRESMRGAMHVVWAEKVKTAHLAAALRQIRLAFGD